MQTTHSLFSVSISSMQVESISTDLTFCELDDFYPNKKNKKRKAKKQENYAETIYGEKVTTVKPSYQDTYTSTTRRKEAQVKITVQQEAPVEDTTVAAAAQNVSKEVPRSFDEETYNRYMLDASGPRKVIDYSMPAGYEDDYVNYDVSDEQAVSGQYRMKHQGEKFSIGRGAIPSSSN